MPEKLLHIERFIFNPIENSGENLILITEYYDNGDKDKGLPLGIFTNQRIELNSYCNTASINLFGTQITPAILRELANKLDEAKIIAKTKLKESIS